MNEPTLTRCWDIKGLGLSGHLSLSAQNKLGVKNTRLKKRYSAQTVDNLITLMSAKNEC